MVIKHNEIEGALARSHGGAADQRRPIGPGYEITREDLGTMLTSTDMKVKQFINPLELMSMAGHPAQALHQTGVGQSA